MKGAALKLKNMFFLSLFFPSLLVILTGSIHSQPVHVNHQAAAEFATIPADYITQAKNTYRIFYGHSSHGAQLVQGMGMLLAENPLYAYNNGAGTLALTEYAGDLGSWGDTSWVPVTRQQLDNPKNDFNMVIWAWCGGVANNNEAGINVYLNAMTQLEQTYPTVTFIYMTGPLDRWAPVTVRRNNQFIRDYCLANDKVLYDFADIESYDPEGVYYPDETDSCGWCYEWCAIHECPDCPGCAHSHCFNCYQKGKAFWWMLATLAGWNDTTGCCTGLTGNVDCSEDENPDISDISSLIDHLYISHRALCCLAEADCNVSGGPPDISDITALINLLYINHESLPACP